MRPKEKLVLVGVVNRKKDLEIAFKEHWYRIPFKHLPKRKAKYLALYQTRVFDKEGKAINYYASIKGSSLHKRSELLPDELNHLRSEDYYQKLNLGPLKATPERIENRYGRRINFAFTTLERLLEAKEISELLNIVPIEEIMRQALKNCGIKAIGQHSIMENKKLRYRLDFAVFCQKGKLNIECDDLRWHSQPKQREKDKKRDRWLRRHGWTVSRFSGEEIKNNIANCVKILKQIIQNLGGLSS
jgi:very-short-patch-repair endonuclease